MVLRIVGIVAVLLGVIAYQGLAAAPRDIMLVYCERPWNLQQFLPYVAYLDTNGKPQDWFYDSFLFMMYGGAPSGQTYYDGATNKQDWEHFLNAVFASDTGFAALEEAMVKVAEQLRSPVPTMPVMVMIPYPSPRQENFGDVDGDGNSEDLRQDADRLKVVRWFIRSFLQRWREKKYPHLYLWGFYWMNEGIDARDENIVRETAVLIHRLRYQFLWIPYFNAPGIERWRELGFDLAILQPNFAFMKVSPGTLRIPDENRLTVTANRCRQLGMGIEMELNEALFSDEAYRVNLQMYLDHGDKELDGYQHDLPRATYQGYDTIARLCRSENPRLRALYDDLYRFHQRKYTRRKPYQPLLTPRLEGYSWKELECLTDRVWRTRADRAVSYVKLRPGVHTLEFNLLEGLIVSDFRVHWVLTREDRLSPPRLVRLLLSGEAFGEQFEEVAAEDLFELDVDNGGGFTILHFPMRFARRARLVVEVGEGENVGVDEVLLMPAPHLLWGKELLVEGAPHSAVGYLTDGVVNTGGALCRNLKLSVPPEILGQHVADALWLHFHLVSQLYTEPVVTVFLNGEQLGEPITLRFSSREMWVRITLPPDRLPHKLELTVTERHLGATGLDEVALLPARNLALGRPYVLEPPFPAAYPDPDGKKLTDGEITREGFGDGKTVGWSEWDGTSEVTLVFELEQVASVDEVALHLQGGGYGAVHFPRFVGASVSEDGVRWRLVSSTRQPPASTEPLTLSDGLGRAELGWLRLPMHGEKARLVKLRLKVHGWLMLSEVQILSAGQNLALGRPYTLQPAPTSSARYADNTGKLTDGVYSTEGSGWALCAGFDQGEPSVTVDLQVLKPIRLARAHLVGGGPGAVWFPEEMRVAVSVDGKQWFPVGATRERPAESGDKPAVGFMAVQFAPRQARYVRFQFVRRGWLMVDELEVW